jgi:chaperonin GroEL
LVIGGQGRRADIETRCRWLRECATRTGDAHGARAARERLGRLTGGIATIRVGGATELERRERRERFESARRAAIAATGDGVVAGGGAALLHAARKARAAHGASVADRAGGAIVAQALTAPLRQIATNAGADGSTIAAHLADIADPSLGFDAVRLDCADMLGRGIVDPVTTITTALRKAASVAGLVLGSHAIVLERPARKSARHPFACRCSEHDHAHYPGDPYHAHHHDHHHHVHRHSRHHQ